MMTGSETQARIKPDDRLPAPSPASAPGWLNEQASTNFDRPKMPLPGIRPVFPSNSSEANSAIASAEAARFYLVQPRPKRFSACACPIRPAFQISRQGDSAGADVRVGANGFAQYLAQQLCHCLF